MQRIWLWVLYAMLAGCATPARLIKPPPPSAGEKPILVGAHGPLSAERSQAILARLSQEAGGSDILLRHIRVEEALTQFPLTIGNKVTLLRDGPATYRAMYEAIHNARDHINLETYIFRDDQIGRQLADLLIKRQREGIQVNVIYDSVGSIKTPDEFFDRMRKAGIKVLEFNPVNPTETRKRYVIEHRDHRKILIVDGRIAFTGGINYDSVYSGGSLSRPKRVSGNGKTPWRDTHVRIEGPAVAEFQKLFLGTWNKQKGAPLPARNYFPPLGEPGHQIVRVIGSTPDSGVSIYHATLLSAVKSAEHTIHVTNAYFVPDDALIEGLKSAAGRSVDVELLLPSESDFWAPLYAGRSHYGDLLSAQVQIHELREAMLHAKTVVIDGVWSTIGSTNLDWRSFLLNDEVDAVILGADFGQQMEAMFKADIAHSNAIDVAHWRKRGVGSRFKEMGARMWEKWL